MPTEPPKSALLSLQDRVARVYYTHGLFCSTHPVPVISIALTIILLCCYPFINLPFPGYVPLEHSTPCQSYIAPERVEAPLVTSGYRDSFTSSDGQLQPNWYHGLPVGYVQQILVRSAVFPWSGDLIARDAFRAPISKAFDILEVMQNYQYADQNQSLMLGDICLHVSEAKVKSIKYLLPTYGCLVVSPANVWQQDMQRFLSDPDLIKSINALGRKTTDPKSALNDVLFGVPWKETAIKNVIHLSRQRVLSYAVTFILKEYDLRFIQGLEERLQRSFPFLHKNKSVVGGNMTHIYFQGQYSLVEFVPLIVTYVILFLYIYFSVRKIEMVKSKIGMAFSAVVTVVASLCMSVGLCTWFGLSFTIKAGQVYLKDIFPYLVVIIGLENILVLTKSVVSTPVNLDVKVRLAQGLSREGWSITKNLVTELSILTFGFFTFVPAIQEFCLFAVVGLLSDFFLQLVFFATILAIDIGRMEMSDLQKQSLHQRNEPSEEELTHMYPLLRWSLVSRMHRQEIKSPLASAGSSTSLFSQDDGIINPAYPTSVVPPSYAQSSKAATVKVPKRLRLVYFLARCRIFQRAFMIIFICWVSFICYKSGLVDLFTFENTTSSRGIQTSTVNVSMQLASMHLPQQAPGSVATDATSTSPPTISSSARNDPPGVKHSPLPADGKVFDEVLAHGLKHRDYELWRYLLKDHFPTLFGYYNISLNGRYITILPPIKLSIPIEAENAIQMRHPSTSEDQTPEMSSSKKWLGIVEKDLDEGLGELPPATASQNYHQGYYPSSPAEVVLAVILAIPSLAFLVYITIVLYQCICSRNYAEWRSSWTSTKGRGEAGGAADIFTQLVIEAMPVVLEGHPQEVECLATDGHLVVSSCLASEIRVWDSASGECLSVVDRKRRCTLKQNYRSARGLQHGNHHADRMSPDIEAPASLSPTSSPGGNKKPRFPTNHFDDWPPFVGTLGQPHVPAAVAGRSGSSLIRNRSTEDFTQVSPSSSHPVNIANFGFDTVSGVRSRHSDLFKRQPNLAPTIETDFSASKSSSVPNAKDSVASKRHSALSASLPSMISPSSSELDKTSAQGFDFGGRFQIYYDEHRQLMDEENEEESTLRTSADELSPNLSLSPTQTGVCQSLPSFGGRTGLSGEADDPTVPLSSVWCIDCSDSIIVAGCSDGPIELWNTLSGALMCLYEDTSHQGVTGIRIYGNRIIAVRISGTIDFLELAFSPSAVLSVVTSCSSPAPTSSMHRRIHTNFVMTSAPEKVEDFSRAWEHDDEEVSCRWLRTLKAHQQPITVFEVEGGKAVTGSQDHTLKVFRVDDASCQIALHGHYGPITTLFIDKLSPMTAASGSHDGAVCLWDLQTGTCVCRLGGHDGAVTALSYTASYVLSAGTDNRLLVWERFQGHLLNTIYLNQSYCASIIMLTDNLLLTGRQGSLGVWDIRLGDPVRIVKLGNSDDSVLVRQIRHVGHTIVCDYGSQLRVVRFPSIVEKID